LPEVLGPEQVAVDQSESTQVFIETLSVERVLRFDCKGNEHVERRFPQLLILKETTHPMTSPRVDAARITPIEAFNKGFANPKENPFPV
jgi:hypothetical protein